MPVLCRDKRLERGGVVRGASMDVARPTRRVECFAIVHFESWCGKPNNSDDNLVSCPSQPYSKRVNSALDFWPAVDCTICIAMVLSQHMSQLQIQTLMSSYELGLHSGAHRRIPETQHKCLLSFLDLCDSPSLKQFLPVLVRANLFQSHSQPLSFPVHHHLPLLQYCRLIC